MYDSRKPICRRIRGKLDALYYSTREESAFEFVLYCLELLRKGYDLAGYFSACHEAYAQCIEDGLADLVRSHSGYVYLAVNAVMPAGVHKIGLTRKTLERRMQTLASSGCLGKFELIQAWPAAHVSTAEAVCKTALADRHVDGEFFYGTYQNLQEIISQVMECEARLVEQLRYYAVVTA